MENIFIFIPHIVASIVTIGFCLLVKYGKTEEEIKKIKQK